MRDEEKEGRDKDQDEEQVRRYSGLILCIGQWMMKRGEERELVGTVPTWRCGVAVGSTVEAVSASRHRAKAKPASAQGPASREELGGCLKERRGQARSW